MTTKEAFTQLTSKRAWYKLCGLAPANARSLKRHFKDGKLSEEYIRKLLKSAGYSNIPESWEPPEPSESDNDSFMLEVAAYLEKPDTE